MKLYTLAHTVHESDPSAPDEDFALFADEVAKLVDSSSDTDL
jgi:hypothetical protein